MNCTTCRFELSQCLDGRLPSGRRTVVMEHAENCAGCGSFWAELQAAQQLTLQLRRPRVSAEFREALWQRIQAGEGTPDAVFREPVPMLAKVRYALLGAAAAAAALFAVTLLTKNNDGVPNTDHLVARDRDRDNDAAINAKITGGAQNPRGTVFHQSASPVDDTPFLAATQPLTFDLVARETAKQLDLRHAAVTMDLRRLEVGEQGGGAVPHGAVQKVLQNADEFLAFGELLLDLRSRKRLEFNDADVGADLRVAVDMLSYARTSQRDLQAVRTFVVPALRSNRLASVSRAILVAPTFDRHEDLEALRSLSSMRPDVFPKLFFVLPSDAEIAQQFGLFRSGSTFLQFDDCGPSWVAPRSEVELRDGRLRILRNSSAGATVEVQIQVGGK